MSYQPRRIVGLRAPLFDRLVDSAPEQPMEVSSPRIDGRDALRLSIARDLHRLLNTRRTSTALLDASTASVLDYGVPDFSHLSAASVTDRRTVAEMLRGAIACFEPRLQDVSVVVESDSRSQSVLVGIIACKARLGSFIEPVTFPVVLNCGDGNVAILEPVTETTKRLHALTNLLEAPQDSHHG
jgi:type VI secretion system lysozyme-like protein